MKNIFKILAFLILLTGCEDIFSPDIENIRGLDAMYKEPTYAQGILANAYILLPYSASPISDVATDDAVTNDRSNNYLRMATGSWSSNDNPMSQWQGRKNAIQYLNIFLDNADKVVWSKDPLIATLYNDRLKGEAYGLRAIHMYYLLMAHGGWTSDGALMGVPVITEPEDKNSDFNKPRNTFQDCLNQIFEDAGKAIELLPLDFGDISNAQIPAKYLNLGITNSSDYNRVNGNHMRGRLTGRIVEAVKAQVSLLAASPAYSAGTNVSWENAANNAAVVLNRINGVSGLAANGGIWFRSTEIEGLASGMNRPEVLWRGDIAQSLTLEQDNYPPSIFGRGRVNPTQNLVNAFPMVNGYPITNPLSNYNAAAPYTNRDPRLANYIVVNGSTQGPNNSVITTGTFGTNSDVINKENGLSTRTGYYLRKLLRADCNPNPSFNTQQKHYTTRIRYTEIFLAYAEAANEAWGPLGTGGNAYSAYDVIKAIRQRAGVGITNNHEYLESVKSDKDLMRALIRNERRLELCFENHRFWDLRRWKVSNLNETARGMLIEGSSATPVYTTIDVEIRDYDDHMYYGPIPYSEIQKWSKLKQNAGW